MFASRKNKKYLHKTYHYVKSCQAVSLSLAPRLVQESARLSPIVHLVHVVIIITLDFILPVLIIILVIIWVAASVVPSLCLLIVNL